MAAFWGLAGVTTVPVGSLSAAVGRLTPNSDVRGRAVIVTAPSVPLRDWLPPMTHTVFASIFRRSATWPCHEAVPRLKMAVSPRLA